MMKKGSFFLIVFFICMAASKAVWAQSIGSTMYVAAKTVDVKESSGFFARVIGTFTLGDTVTVQQNRGKWLVVRSASGLQGWVPADAFSIRRVVNTGSGLSATEFALAGKGFTGDLERILGSSGEIDYSGVDAMERRIISFEELRFFLQEGRLAEGN